MYHFLSIRCIGLYTFYYIHCVLRMAFGDVGRGYRRWWERLKRLDEVSCVGFMLGEVLQDRWLFEVLFGLVREVLHKNGFVMMDICVLFVSLFIVAASESWQRPYFLPEDDLNFVLDKYGRWPESFWKIEDDIHFF